MLNQRFQENVLYNYRTMTISGFVVIYITKTSYSICICSSVFITEQTCICFFNQSFGQNFRHHHSWSSENNRILPTKSK